ncbi:MAG TPA: hypothetical protein DCZ91_13735, partial [Lachnospiraceae bacterium]|nr:hypothetical protein [Lachnospiraceae bacterium]
EDDFKYHYKKEDRLEPILNLMLYWGKRKWKEPLCLRDMMEDMPVVPKRLRCLAGDYKVHMISMRFIPEADLQKMNSDLKYVLGIMKYTASRKQYEKYIRDNREFFSRIPKSAVDVIDACTNLKGIMEHLQYQLNQESGEEEADVCKALDDIEKAAVRKGIKQGRKQGERKALFSLVNDGLLRLEEAAKRANLSEQ